MSLDTHTHTQRAYAHILRHKKPEKYETSALAAFVPLTDIDLLAAVFIFTFLFFLFGVCLLLVDVQCSALGIAK